ncbi:MAG: LysR family transcriptional regulator [Pseudomonadota bacterium]
MDTEALRLFVRAVEKLNISGAGRSLGMAPAVSSAKLAKLERSLGTDLLHRSTRKVALSQEGMAFLPYAREILAQEDAALGALGLGTQTISGTLRFTAPSSFAQLYIAPIVPEFLELYPDIDLDLQLSDTRYDLIGGSFDLALRNAPLEDTSLKGRKLADDLRVLCASPAYLARYGTPTEPQDLLHHRLIGFQSSDPKQLTTGAGELSIFDPSTAASKVVIDDGTSHRLATLAGAGISINSLWSVHENLRQGHLVRVLPDYVDAEKAVLWMIYPKANVLSAKVRVLMDFLVEKIGKRSPWDNQN